MDYDLARQLEEAGFPQGGKGDWIGPADNLTWRSGDKVYIPTLEELIEACGDQFVSLSFNAKYRWWYADGSTATAAKSPSAAVARLWLELNKIDASSSLTSK